MTYSDQPMEQQSYGPDAGTRLYFSDTQVGLHENQRYQGGHTQEAARVAIEAGGPNEFVLAVALGSITEADADAIAIPSNAKFGQPHGAIGKALIWDMDTLAGVQLDYDGPGNGPGAQFFRNSIQQTREHLKQSDREGVPLGSAAAFPSGQLAKRGIYTVVLTDIEPAKGEQQLTPAMVSVAVKNALRAAEYAGATSLAITEFGTGRMAPLFPHTRNAWAATIHGYMQYIGMARTGEARGTVTRLSIVTQAEVTEENSRGAGRLLDEAIGIAIAV